MNADKKFSKSVAPSWLFMPIAQWKATDENGRTRIEFLESLLRRFAVGPSCVSWACPALFLFRMPFRVHPCFSVARIRGDEPMVPPHADRGMKATDEHR